MNMDFSYYEEEYLDSEDDGFQKIPHKKAMKQKENNIRRQRKEKMKRQNQDFYEGGY